jgi:hypothetical protein
MVSLFRLVHLFNSSDQSDNIRTIILTFYYNNKLHASEQRYTQYEK